MADPHHHETQTGSPCSTPRSTAASFEDSSDGIVLTDTASHILRANRAWLAMHGYEAHEVIGRKTSIVRSPLTTDAVYPTSGRRSATRR
jgi:PAS domain S-box-containing protein